MQFAGLDLSPTAFLQRRRFGHCQSWFTPWQMKSSPHFGGIHSGIRICTFKLRASCCWENDWGGDLSLCVTPIASNKTHTKRPREGGKINSYVGSDYEQINTVQEGRELISNSLRLLCMCLCSTAYPYLSNYSHEIEYKSRCLIFLQKISPGNQIPKCIFYSGGFISKSNFYHLSAKVRFKHPHCNVRKMNICFSGYCANQ